MIRIGCYGLLQMMILTILWCTITYAGSEPAVIFLMIEPDARACGMGEAFVAVADNGSAPYWNPAGLGFMESERQATLMHANWLPDIWNWIEDELYYEFAGYVQPVEGWGVVGGYIQFFSLGKNAITVDSPVPIGYFYSYDTAFTLSYGSKVSDNLALGVNMKLIYSHLAPKIDALGMPLPGTGTSFAIDLGTLYKGPINGLSLGVAVQNIGPKIAYISEEHADPLPRNLRAGFAYRILDTKLTRLMVVADINKMLVNLDADWEQEFKESIQNFGIEFWYLDFLALRSGYLRDITGRITGTCWGCGIRYQTLQFDFALVPGGDLSDWNQRFSLSAKF